MEGILESIKKMLGIGEDYDHFDSDLIMHINSVFSILTQLGVGPTEGYVVEDENDLWTDFIGDSTLIEMAKTYTYMKVRLIFDPPSSSAVMESYNNIIKELEWRINVAVDTSSSE